MARRLGLELQGVGFPGHFLVKCPEQPGLPGEVFIDAFNGWELLGSDECTARFRAVLHGRPFDPSLLDPVDSRHILTRLLHNLKRIYVERGDDVRTLWVVDRLLQITPDDLEERRDRGLVSARLGRHGRGGARPRGLRAGKPAGLRRRRRPGAPARAGRAQVAAQLSASAPALTGNSRMTSRSTGSPPTRWRSTISGTSAGVTPPYQTPSG